MTNTPSERPILSVSQLNRFIRNWLEQDMGRVHIEGEISNATYASSGHCYFTLKDTSAQLRCVFFRNKHLAHQKIEHGQHIIASGTLSLYEARGDYQLIVDAVEEAGLGELYRAYQLLKNKLAAEGLFDASRKKSIPLIPTCIGIITSASGAALHDIQTTLMRRYPLAPSVLYPSDVQGAQAAQQLIDAIQKANQEALCDVLILARGGGSLEDLWSFNHEGLAYAIAESNIPIVSGIGHETDFTIADFVADYRAATPTAAAETVTPHWQELHQRFSVFEQRLKTAMIRLYQQKEQQLSRLKRTLASPKYLIDTHWQTLDYLTRQLHQTMHQQLTQKKHALQIACQALNTLSPLATLARGYAIVTHDNHVLKSSHDVQPGDRIDIKLTHGALTCLVL